MTFIKNLKNLSSLALKVVEYFMVFIIFILLILLAVWTIHIENEFYLKFIGVILQFVGICYALWVLVKIWKSLSETTFQEAFTRYIKNIPRLTKKNIIEEISLDTSTGLNFEAEVWAPDNEVESEKERIGKIVRNINELLGQNNQIKQSLNQLIQENVELKKFFNNTKEEIFRKFKEDLKNIHIGDWVYSFMSLIFIFVGSVFSSFSQEIVLFFNSCHNS